MSRKISLRLRVTLVCGVLLAVCCLLLTVSHTYSAYEMADAIEATPLQPAQAIGACETGALSQLPMAAVSRPARETFRMQSVVAMGIIVVSGCLMVYWLTGKALAPLRRLDEQIRSRTASDLDPPSSRARQRGRGGRTDGLLQPDVPKPQPGLPAAKAVCPVCRP